MLSAATKPDRENFERTYGDATPGKSGNCFDCFILSDPTLHYISLHPKILENQPACAQTLIILGIGTIRFRCSRANLGLQNGSCLNEGTPQSSTLVRIQGPL